MADFIDVHSKKWNAALVSQVFTHDLAADILNTPLYDQVPVDNMVWKVERNGIYSVRSAYRLCVEELVDTSHLRRPGYWSGIWRLKVPPKVRNFVWRVCRGMLPTRVRLQDKGVQCPTNCVSCADGHEDLSHVFFDCPFVIQVWHSSGLWEAVHHTVMNNDSAVGTVFSLLQNLSSGLSQRFAANLWSVWKHRNIKLWRNEDELYAQVV